MASLFGLALSLMQGGPVAPVTLYAISQDISSGAQVNQISIAAGHSLSVAGSNFDGGTTYVDVEVVTSEFFIGADTTVTGVSAPATATFTWVEDASGMQESFLESASGITPETVVDSETCGFGNDGRGTCVKTLVFPQTTEAITFSGKVVPVFTLVAAPPSPSKGNAALRSVYTGWTVLSAAVVMALFQAV
ncbi:hypothetical protein K438DRAFT_1993884 [Mycena galopus ATCC 62051]|nr:hypothetical protein K438DRAFT_1993884 [Mycena galopus ATCC 62051]